jgi:AcrR family transcriptional regulator
MSAAVKPTRREERRAQTVQEIKDLAMEQVRQGGPDAVSLSGIVREMSMSPAAVYRYFANRDALLADLVVDAYNELADSLSSLSRGSGSADDHLDAVLRGTRAWALEHPNAYRLIFQSAAGSGQDLAAERTVPASSRSMAVIVEALAAVAGNSIAPLDAQQSDAGSHLVEAIRAWAVRTGTQFSPEVITLGFLTWTRLHGIISLELGGHLAATGIGAPALFEAELDTIHTRAAQLPVAALGG